MASVKQLLNDTLDELEEEKLRRFKSYLKEDGPIPASVLGKADATETVDQMLDRLGPESAVKIMLHILKKMNQNHLAEQLEKKHTEVSSVLLTEDWMVQKFLKTHKMNMKKKAERIFECKKENEVHLKAVYTELFITEGDMKDVYQEREILKIDDAFRKKQTEDKPINCNKIFTLLRENNDEKIVLTKGIAGIGKTVSVHKFILDWAEGEANQDIHCVFLLPFREINRIKNREVSLHEFLQEFYNELKDMEKSKLYTEYKLAFIFDGLDESRLPLNFESGTLNTVEKRSSVDVLFTSLVKGKLLPSALIWVTSRPAAANQIHPEYVGLFTEVRGFTDQQKEEYFRKRITDETQVSRIISHIKTSRSLYIMCHIPVFCWITATVLQNILINNSEENISTTLTEMYIHFLLIQMNMKNQKYDGKAERQRIKLLHLNKEIILKLAKLAFEHLKQDNIVFYEEDLEECDIDVSKDIEFAGMIAEIFKIEDGLHETKFYCFVHLSVQEFFAAVHVFICYLNKNLQELQFFFDEPKEDIKLLELLQKAVDKAMKSRRGHLDLFLRFLMGISLKSSQNLLKGLITHTEDTTESITKTTTYIKQEQNKYNISDEAVVNLFFCLLELKDHSLYEEIQSYLSSDVHSGRDLSSSMCTVLTYVLLMSEKVLDEFNPKRFTSSSSNYTRLIPAVRCCKKALFDSCGFDEKCCETVSSALQQSNSHLTELDLSSNHLQDSGVKIIYDGLRNPYCQLNILRLCGCFLTAQSCESLSSALQSSNSVLRELDLSNNDLQDSGVKLLSDGLKHVNSKLEVLRFSICNLTAQSCGSLSSVLKSSNTVLRDLDLSNNDLQDSGVMLLSEGLKSPNCQMEILRLSGWLKINIDPQNHGFCSSVLLECSLCERDRYFRSVYTSTRLQDESRNDVAFDVNVRMVLLAHELGMGYAALKKISKVLGIPSLHLKTYQRHNRKVTVAEIERGLGSLHRAREQIRQAYAEVDTDVARLLMEDEDAVINISVSFDGTWHKRGFTSNYGIGVCIDVLTGSSKAMEQEAAKRMWARSVSCHQVRYTEMLSDGDSAAFKEVVALNHTLGMKL
ncbi:hypothetical protein QQF64_035928 [Cirrhinus molitorella]|uniref:NACHT, LRR and PYD domains-containing protein 12-like n=1 Tax=Cirrhinus molitorella TaxID=172907 RepID=A0ABR3NH90_9TELE